MIRLCAALREDAPHDPAPFWMLRATLWSRLICSRPKRSKQRWRGGGRTTLPPPDELDALRQQFNKRLAAGEHADVVAEAEALFERFPLWLDLQRWAGERAARALGETGASGCAGRARDLAVVLLGGRQPALLQRGSDLRWRDRRVADPGCERLSIVDADAGIGWPAERRASRRPSRRAAGPREAHQRGDERTERHELRMKLVEVLLHHERSDIAVPLCEELLLTADTCHLSTWQPALFAQTIRLCVRAARDAELALPRRATLWTKLCQISPRIAFELGPELQN